MFHSSILYIYLLLCFHQALIAKSKMLGNIKFIGELGKLNMLHERILHQCVKQLLEKKKETPPAGANAAAGGWTQEDEKKKAGADPKAADNEVSFFTLLDERRVIYLRKAFVWRLAAECIYGVFILFGHIELFLDVVYNIALIVVVSRSLLLCQPSKT